MTDNDRIDEEWIRARLSSSGKTQRQLASHLGIDSSGVSRLLDGSRGMKIAEIDLVRSFFDGTREVSTSRGDGPSDTTHEAQRDGRRSGPKPRNTLRTDLPVYSTSSSARSSFLEMNTGPPVEYRACPPQLWGVGEAFALFVSDDGLAPRIRSGECIYIHPSRPPSFGMDVFVRFRSPNGRIAILRYVGRDGTRLQFSSINAGGSFDSYPPKRPVTLNETEILQMGRVVLTSSN